MKIQHENSTNQDFLSTTRKLFNLIATPQIMTDFEANEIEHGLWYNKTNIIHSFRLGSEVSAYIDENILLNKYKITYKLNY